MIRGWVAREEKRSLTPMRENVAALALQATGFLAQEEGLKLFELARELACKAPCLEVGAYCGKSALYLAEGCRASGGFGLFSVDHHRGSVEQQSGQRYFNPSLFDASRSVIDTLPHFLENIARADLRDYVVPIVADSAIAGRNFPTSSLSLVFIDGGHAREDVESDWQTWGRTIVRGGALCFHDIYPDPAKGGQSPREVFESVCARRDWRYEGVFQTLGVVRRR
jgi:MMP 1-O-methyltransferase